MRARASGLLLLAAVLGVIVASCRDATEVSLEARTNIMYRPGLVTTFTVGTSPAAIEENAAAKIETTSPWGSDGFIGSLTVIPPSDDATTLAVKIVMAVQKNDAHDCKPPRYEGCIVARRVLSYRAHASLRLPINLWLDCVGVPCDAVSTCNALGQCVSSQVDASCADGRGCTIPGEEGVASVDASAPGPTRVEGNEGGLDASNDGGKDAGGDGGDGGSLPPIGKDGGTPHLVECTIGLSAPSECGTPQQVCCNHAIQGSVPTFYCTGPENTDACLNEASPAIVLACDGAEDCPGSQVCCESDNATRFDCKDTCELSHLVCHSTKNCGPTATCVSRQLGYYGVCQPHQ